MVKIYLEDDVLTEARKRYKMIFDEFDKVAVTVSGGKDSTVVLNLALQEAEKRGRLPLDVIFIDQEAEWQGTINHIEEIYKDKRVNPIWLQVPFRIFNATSHESDSEWLVTWNPEEEDRWLRKKHPLSVKTNIFGVDRFGALFPAIARTYYKDEKVAILSGVRAEESPTRSMTLTTTCKYKYITYGKKLNKNEEHFTFYPIYDWTYIDVWKFIHSNRIKYNRVYDAMYRLGVNPRDMRISNLNHETAVHELYILEEIEPDTWEKLTRRLKGVHATRNLEKRDSFSPPKDLPFMFRSWKEYRDYLLDNLITDKTVHAKMRKKFDYLDKTYTQYAVKEKLDKVCVSTILANDHYFTKLTNFMNSGTFREADVDRRRRRKRANRDK